MGGLGLLAGAWLLSSGGSPVPELIEQAHAPLKEVRADEGAAQALPPAVAQRFRTQNRGRITDDGLFLLVGQQFRDQPRNKADVIERLRELLVAATRVPKTRRPTRATHGSLALALPCRRA